MIILIVLLLRVFFVNGLVVKGTNWESSENWKFITKFCFKSGGTFKIDVTSESTSGYISSYTDVGHSWEAFDSDATCDGKVEAAISSFHFNKGQTFIWETSYTTLRDRWWFFTVSNCTHTPVKLENYKLTFLNPGGLFQRHFSANEDGIAEMIIAFWIISSIISIWSAYLCHFSLLPVGQYKLIRATACICSVQTLGLFFTMIDKLIFAHNGIGVPELTIISIIIVITTHVSLLYVGLMVSRGWGVSDAVNLGYAPLIGVFCFLVALFEILVWIWYIKFIDPIDVREPIHAWPGYCLCFIQASAFFYLAFNTFRYTMPLLTSRDARNFYVKFTFVFGLWLFSLPLSIFITLFVSDHTRTKVVFGLDFTTLMCFYVALIFLFRHELSWRYTLDQLLTASVPADGNKFDAIELQENHPEQQREVILGENSSENSEDLGSP